MKNVQLAILLICICSPISFGLYVSNSLPYQNGELPVESFAVNPGIDGLEEDLLVYVPQYDSSYVLTIFLGGLEGNIPVGAYDDVLANIASHGTIVVGISIMFTDPLSSKIPSLVSQAIQWIQENINSQIVIKYGQGITAITNNTLAVGHSAGSKIIVAILESGCKHNINGVVLLDPVDGSDPWEMFNQTVITPGRKLNYTVPTLILGTGLESTPEFNMFGLFPACAPKKMAFMHFYNATNCPVWLINATEWGHADFLNWEYYIVASMVCTTNKQSNANFAAYRGFVAGVVNSFMMALFQGACDNMIFVEYAELIPEAVGLVDLKSSSNCLSGTCPTPFCKTVH